MNAYKIPIPMKQNVAAQFAAIREQDIKRSLAGEGAFTMAQRELMESLSQQFRST